MSMITGLEVSPPVQHEDLTLSEEEDLLSETPRRVSSEEELPIEMTSRSIMGCLIEPPESLPLMPMVESNKNEDIMEDKIP